MTDYTFDSKDRIISEVYYEYEGEYTGTLPALDPQVKTTFTSGGKHTYFFVLISISILQTIFI